MREKDNKFKQIKLYYIPFHLYFANVRSVSILDLSRGCRQILSYCQASTFNVTIAFKRAVI